MILTISGRLPGLCLNISKPGITLTEFIEPGALELGDILTYPHYAA
ncbi:hypothetical protein SAMN05421823_1333 [Catalinimonas alkaloidigena]|uniref:Uncharacterized protein n=1 Tax=Catalinimonas alkaloidigena TaxID=1075417 RepID=A0A1G9W3V6_9BACT|nr:hypothetical protein SAMN05421823_1333 [Catalinimonas alkaloidigena]